MLGLKLNHVSKRGPWYFIKQHQYVFTSYNLSTLKWCWFQESSTIAWLSYKVDTMVINPLRPRQNGRHFNDDTLNRIFLNDIVRISIKISMKFVPKGPINTIPALVQILAWRRPGNKPLSEPIMNSLPTHICVTRPQWINHRKIHSDFS